ncbi:MAG: hypothetical protein H0Z32_05020 [Bacillaceae bacterium]|nr:hypothetical protein [Bacillaceae bacterium]
MTRKELEDKISQLKMDYIRIQGDLDKMESVGGNVSPLEKTLQTLENELKELREQLAAAKE